MIFGIRVTNRKEIFRRITGKFFKLSDQMRFIVMRSVERFVKCVLLFDNV